MRRSMPASDGRTLVDAPGPPFVLPALRARVAGMLRRRAPRASTASRSTFGSARCFGRLRRPHLQGHELGARRLDGTGCCARCPSAAAGCASAPRAAPGSRAAASRKNRRSCVSTVGLPSRELTTTPRPPRLPRGTEITSPGLRLPTARPHGVDGGPSRGPCGPPRAAVAPSSAAPSTRRSRPRWQRMFSR